MNDVGKRWKTVRKRLEMTQEEFAERLGASRQHIALIESGKRRPSETLSMLMRKTFEIDRDWLVSGKGEQEDNPFDMSGVKNCPFCGGRAGMIMAAGNRKKVYQVCCGRCGARTAMARDFEFAKEMWNKRKGEIV